MDKTTQTTKLGTYVEQKQKRRRHNKYDSQRELFVRGARNEKTHIHNRNKAPTNTDCPRKTTSYFPNFAKKGNPSPKYFPISEIMHLINKQNEVLLN